MTFKERISRIEKELEEIEEDISTLQANIKAVRDFLATNPTEDDAKANKEIGDIERGLKHIELY